MSNYAGEKRRQALGGLSLLGAMAHDYHTHDQVKDYIDLLEERLNRAFELLSRDNVYSPNINEAWKLLGETLGRTSSKDKPFQEAADD